MRFDSTETAQTWLYDATQDIDVEVQIDFQRCPAEPDVGIQRPYNEVYEVRMNTDLGWVAFDPDEDQMQEIYVYLGDLR